MRIRLMTERDGWFRRYVWDGEFEIEEFRWRYVAWRNEEPITTWDEQGTLRWLRKLLKGGEP